MTSISEATVVATPIRFGLSSDSLQRWDDTHITNTTTYVHTIQGVNTGQPNPLPAGHNFDLNDKAAFTLTIVSTGGDIDIKGDRTKLGVGDEFVDAGESLTLSLSVSIDVGYRLKELYIDQVHLSSWGNTDTVTFSDGEDTPNTHVYGTGQNDSPVLRYDGTPDSTMGSDPTWRDLNSGEVLVEPSNLTALSIDNIGGIGDNTWELKLEGSKFSLADVHIHYEVEAVPEPSNIAFLALGGIVYTLRRKRA